MKNKLHFEQQTTASNSRAYFSAEATLSRALTSKFIISNKLKENPRRPRGQTFTIREKKNPSLQRAQGTGAFLLGFFNFPARDTASDWDARRKKADACVRKRERKKRRSPQRNAAALSLIINWPNDSVGFSCVSLNIARGRPSLKDFEPIYYKAKTVMCTRWRPFCLMGVMPRVVLIIPDFYTRLRGARL